MKKIFLLICTFLLTSSAFAKIPQFDLNTLPGRYSCKVGDRQSRAYFNIAISGENIEFKFDNEKHVFWFNKSELQYFMNKSPYNIGRLGYPRAVGGIEEKRNERTEYFSYELIYHEKTKQLSLNSFGLLSEGGFFSRDVKYDCIMIDKEN